uniref:CSON001648 protein n=1 Tax=Culicoides sonorensis TaxID=179676 RepID=A0A336MJU3_CULSO
MWQFGLLSLLIAGTHAVPAYSSSGAAAGSYAGGSSGGGSGLYSSNYIGTGTYGPSFPYVGGFTYAGGAPGFGYGFVPPFGFGFNNDLQNFISAQYNHLQSQFNSLASATHAISTKGASAKAEASFGANNIQLDKPHLYNKQFAQQAAFLNHLQETSNIQPGQTVIYTNYPTEVVHDKVKPHKTGNRVNTVTNYAPTYSGAAYGASAGGAIGPGGVYQSVSTYPGGTLSNRFGDAPTSTHYVSSGPGFSGISTFASSDSSGNRQAVTSVNNNGKVTTYHTRN